MIKKLENKLIVSCQALEGEPLHGSETMVKMAKAAIEGGAIAIRAQGVEDIKAIKKAVDVPVIGLIKKDYPKSDVYITPTKKEVLALLETDCEIIALDATLRDRPNDESLAELVTLIKKEGRLAMADCATIKEAKAAEKLGFDIVSSTLSGYTDETRNNPGPDLKFIEEMITELKVPVIAEGRIHTFEDLKNVAALNPYSIVIGGAITRPQEITARFLSVLKDGGYLKV